MKKITVFSSLAACAVLLSHANPAMAGVLTITSGPNFTPDTAFTDNTIVVNTIVVGGLIEIVGGASITPDASNQAAIDLSGDYSADVGDMLSAAYSFTVDLNIETPATYTVEGTALVLGVPVDFNTSGTLESGLHKYEGTLTAPVSFPVALAGTFSVTLTFDFGPAGLATEVTPGSLDFNFQQVDLKLDPLPATLVPPSQPLNISTRADVGTDENVLIGGFIVTGNDPKQVVLRAIGPSLSLSGLNGLLADPFLELHDATGALLASNDNWTENSAEDQMILTDNKLAPTDDLESALVQTLDPGAYTAIVHGVNNTTGIALVEAYDINSATTDSKLANISTRGDVETGDNVMIGGFIVGGGGGFSTVIVRGIGPSLVGASLTNILADPMIDLYNADGDLIDSNDNWMDDPNMQSVIDNNLAPTDPNESALFKILPQGAYTAILSGVGGTTGVGLVETYNVDGMTLRP